jgi:putative component of toxin-antitoxin plasmid stabilization module
MKLENNGSTLLDSGENEDKPNSHMSICQEVRVDKGGGGNRLHYSDLNDVMTLLLCVSFLLLFENCNMLQAFFFFKHLVF